MRIKEMECQTKIFGLIRKLDSCSTTLLRPGSSPTSAGLNREGKTNRKIEPVPQGYDTEKRIKRLAQRV
jgi:hypothetical protein